MVPKKIEEARVTALADDGCVEIRGARQNNLKGIDLDLPLGQLTVITGPSGSGKSSLAFETIYAEGQRRYVETFSPYMRQFLDRPEWPEPRANPDFTFKLITHKPVEPGELEQRVNPRSRSAKLRVAEKIS